MSETDFTNPQSRVEKILAKTIQKYTGDLENPQSRIEKLLVELNSYIEQLASGSSGGSTPDWNVTDETADGFIKNKPPVKSGKGNLSVVEGSGTAASAFASHAEGTGTAASGKGSHAEGNGTAASADDSHAEGYAATASGIMSHAEGRGTRASGTASHAEGDGTIAKGDASHVCGKFNIADENSLYAEVVGNGGGNSSRSNARTLDWNGNEYIAGRLTMGLAPENDLDAATKKYVDDLAAQKGGSSSTPDWEADDESEGGFIKNKPPVFADSDGTSVYEGGADSASGKYSHAEGYMTSTEEAYAHAEGQETTASGQASHAEGYKCTVKIQASYAHAEGRETEANETYSHSEGYGTAANAAASHVEGDHTVANGYASHAEGDHTIAAGSCQHCFGTYNVSDEESLEIVGNGESEDARSNARTLDASGNEHLAGKLTIGAAPTEDMDVTTKKYVDDLVAALTEKIAALTPASS